MGVGAEPLRLAAGAPLAAAAVAHLSSSAGARGSGLTREPATAPRDSLFTPAAALPTGTAEGHGAGKAREAPAPHLPASAASQRAITADLAAAGAVRGPAIAGAAPLELGAAQLFSRRRWTASMAAPTAAGSVLITGASSGVGAATARLFASRGAALFLVGRDSHRLSAVASQCMAQGAQARFIRLQLAPAHVIAAVSAVPQHYLRPPTLLPHALPFRPRCAQTRLDGGRGRGRHGPRGRR